VLSLLNQKKINGPLIVNNKNNEFNRLNGLNRRVPNYAIENVVWLERGVADWGGGRRRGGGC